MDRDFLDSYPMTFPFGEQIMDAPDAADLAACSLLPTDVVAVALAGPARELACEELGYVLHSSASPRRRAEFATGRACARAACQRLGVRCGAIPAGPFGEPVWPRGAVGSITHCESYTLAAVAAAEAYRSIGVDAERNARLPPETIDLVLSDPEKESLHRNDADAPHWDRLIFSAKEAVFKAWFPLARSRLDFQDVRISIDRRAGSFSATVLRPGAFRRVSGRFLVTRRLIVTAIALAAAARRPAAPATGSRLPPAERWMLQ